MFLNVTKIKFVKVSLFLLTSTLGFSNLWGQTTIVENSFEETSSDTWAPFVLSTPECTNGSDIWDYRTSLSSISPSDGSQFWGIQDLNGNCGGSGFETISFPSISVSAYTNVEISFDYYTIGFDNGDDLGYEIWEDGSKVQDVNNIAGSTSGWMNIVYNITTGVTNVYLVLKAKQNGGSDYAGFDNVRVTGTSAGPTLTASPSSLSDLNYVVGNGPSTVQSFDLSGTSLDGTNVELATIIDDCEISLSSNSGFSHYINLPAFNGTSTTIYVRLKAGLVVDSYIDQILITGGGVASANEPEIDLEGDVWLTAPPLVYCDAQGTGTNYEHISNVEFGTIDFSSGSNGYEDNTSESTNVTAGQTYPLIVDNGNPYSSDEIYVWVDWNQDGDFDDTGEEVVSGLNANFSVISSSITIPASAISGATRMRIRLLYTSSSPNYTPCGDHGDGEVEDYTINVIAPCSVTTPTLPSSTQTCGSTEYAATPNSGTETTYWQTAASGTSTADPANVTKTVTSTTAIYLRTYSSSEDCWSAALTVNPNVIENPVISSQPADQSEIVGQNVTFSVSATNASSYQWQVSTDNGGSWSFMSGEVNATLDLSGVSLAMDGNLYRVNVIANSPCSDVLSNSATLNVVNGPCLDEANFTSLPTNWDQTNITFSSNEARFSSQTGELTTLSLSNPNTLTFDLRRTSNSSAKTLYVEVSTTTQGGTYSIVETFSHGNTTSNSTTSCTVDLSAYSSNPTVFIRFRKASSTTSPWYMKNVQVLCGSTPPPCTPSASITSFMPTSGPSETLVTISGSGFTGATEVKFGVTDAISYNVVDDNTIIAEVPTGIGANESIYVVDAASCATVSGNQFTYITNNGTCTDYPGYTDLFISEVYDSNGNNEWLVELYNPTANSITLDGVYDIKRAGDIAVSPTYSRTINLTGVVAANSIYTLNVGTGSSCSISYDFTESGGGINENDMITLFKSGSLVDVVHAPNSIGYSLLRNIGTGVIAPSDTYIAADWSVSNSESCSDFGSFVLPPSTVIDISSSPIDITDCSVTMSVSSSTSGVSYKWMYNDPSSMAGWSEVNNANITSGSITGETSSSLTITGDVFALMDFQFYCEVSGGSCGLASKAAQFKVDSKPIYRSVASANGNWSDYSNWEMSIDNLNYSSACTYPREVNSSEVIIQDGTFIIYDLSGASEISIDKVLIEENATLEILTSSKLTINDSISGADLIVNGTLIDRANSANSLSFSTGTTWVLGGNGTIIKTNAGAISLYRDDYEGGMNSIPSSANWIYRQNGDGNPSVGSVNFFYPNLSFENTTSSVYEWSGVSNAFSGSTGGFVTVKGDFSIGVNGSSACIVSNVNFNTQPMLIHGNLFIATDSKLINSNFNSSEFGSGFELKGNVTVNGELDILGGTTERVLRFTGASDQNISGSGIIDLYKVIVNKSMGSVLLNRDVKIQNELVMTSGNIFSNSNVLELGLSTMQKGDLIYTSGFVVGKMRRWFDGTNSGNSSSLFPLGYNEFGIKNRNTKIEFDSAPSNGGYLTVEYIGAPMAYDGLPIFAGNSNGAGFDITTAEDQGFWKIDNESGKLTDGSYTIYCTGEGYQTISDLSKLTLLKREVANSPNWFCPGTHETTTGSISVPVVSRSGVSGWSNFGFGGGVGNTLPVTLTSFEVSCVNDKNQTSINWTTASETNSAFFTVEKSRDMFNWTIVSERKAAGNSSHYIDYQEIDEKPLNGIAYYRLSQTDFDGKMEVFNPVSVSCLFEENDVRAYPNPSNGEFLLEFNWVDRLTSTQIQIVDVSGRIVYLKEFQLNKGVKQFYINQSNIKAGTYLIVFPNTDLKPIKLVINN